jgi:hypothetical protein
LNISAGVRIDIRVVELVANELSEEGSGLKCSIVGTGSTGYGQDIGYKLEARGI